MVVRSLILSTVFVFGGCVLLPPDEVEFLPEVENDDDDAVEPGPRLTFHIPAADQADVSIETTVVLVFDSALEPSSLDSGLRVSDAAAEIPGNWAWDEAYNRAIFTPNDLLADQETRYTVEVLDSLLSVGGISAEPTSFSFVTPLMDSDYFYRLHTEQFGASSPLGVTARGTCDVQTFDANMRQWWYSTAAPPAHQHLRNADFGDVGYLSGPPPQEMCFMEFNDDATTRWTFPVGEGGFRRLQNEELGSDYSLAILQPAGTAPLSGMVETASGTPAQLWNVTRVGSNGRFNESVGSIPCSTGGQLFADQYIVEGQGTLRVWVQTIDFDSRFDPRLIVTPGNSPPFDQTHLADVDDDIECRHSTAGPGFPRCPDVTVEITGQVSILVLALSECNASGTGTYWLRATFDGSLLPGNALPLVADDFPFP